MARGPLLQEREKGHGAGVGPSTESLPQVHRGDCRVIAAENWDGLGANWTVRNKYMWTCGGDASEDLWA